MIMKRLAILALLGVAAVAGDASAQRGRRAPEFERPDTPMRFDQADLGLAFDVPEGARLYTPAAPGRYRSLLGDGRIVYLENPAMRSVSVAAKVSGNVTEAELKGYKDILDTNPPQAKLEGFKKHHVRFVKIGKASDKEALEFDVRRRSVHDPAGRVHPQRQRFHVHLHVAPGPVRGRRVGRVQAAVLASRIPLIHRRACRPCGPSGLQGRCGLTVIRRGRCRAGAGG